MPELLRSPWMFLLLALGPALVAWFLVEALPGHLYCLIDLKGKRRLFAIWACLVVLRWAFPGLEPTFTWTGVICCSVVVAVVVLAAIWLWVYVPLDDARQRRLRRQTCP